MSSTVSVSGSEKKKSVSGSGSGSISSSSTKSSSNATSWYKNKWIVGGAVAIIATVGGFFAYKHFCAPKLTNLVTDQTGNGSLPVLKTEK